MSDYSETEETSSVLNKNPPDFELQELNEEESTRVTESLDTVAEQLMADRPISNPFTDAMLKMASKIDKDQADLRAEKAISKIPVQKKSTVSLRSNKSSTIRQLTDQVSPSPKSSAQTMSKLTSTLEKEDYKDEGNIIHTPPFNPDNEQSKAPGKQPQSPFNQYNHPQTMLYEEDTPPKKHAQATEPAGDDLAIKIAQSHKPAEGESYASVHETDELRNQFDSHTHRLTMLENLVDKLNKRHLQGAATIEHLSSQFRKLDLKCDKIGADIANLCNKLSSDKYPSLETLSSFTKQMADIKIHVNKQLTILNDKIHSRIEYDGQVTTEQADRRAEDTQLSALDLLPVDSAPAERLAPRVLPTQSTSVKRTRVKLEK